MSSRMRPSQDPLNKEWTTTEALACLDALKTHFREQPMQYKKLLSLITDWRSGRVQSTEMVFQCSSLLRNRPRLLRDVNCLLEGSTEDVKIICSVDESDVNCVVGVYGKGRAGRIGVLHAVSASESLPYFHRSDQLGDDCWDHIRAIESRWAPFVMELLQIKLEDNCGTKLRRHLLKSLRLLNRLHGALPPSIFVHDISCEEKYPIAGGAFADIWKGRRNGQLVCLKVLRYFAASSDQRKLFKDLSNEVLVWKQLQHQNILPLYGVNTDLFQPRYCIVSPWMQNGDIGSYLSRSKQSTFKQKLLFITEIAEGLAYLHQSDPPITHGDIKGANILISDDLHCCLADFGLSLIETQTKSFNPTGSAGIRGSMRWLAPELINPPGFSEAEAGRSNARDIYAFACTVVEILTGAAPFPECRNDAQVMVKVLHGGRPEKPSECPDELWRLIQCSWSEDISERPTARFLVSRLRALLSPPNPFLSLHRIQTGSPPIPQSHSVVSSANQYTSSSPSPASILGSKLDRKTFTSSNSGRPGAHYASSTDTAVVSPSTTAFTSTGSSTSLNDPDNNEGNHPLWGGFPQLDKINMFESDEVGSFCGDLYKSIASPSDEPEPSSSHLHSASSSPRKFVRNRVVPVDRSVDISRSRSDQVPKVSWRKQKLSSLFRSVPHRHQSDISDLETSASSSTRSRHDTWHDEDFDPYSEHHRGQKQSMVSSSTAAPKWSSQRGNSRPSGTSIAPGILFNSEFLPSPSPRTNPRADQDVGDAHILDSLLEKLRHGDRQPRRRRKAVNNDDTETDQIPSTSTAARSIPQAGFCSISRDFEGSRGSTSGPLSFPRSTPSYAFPSRGVGPYTVPVNDEEQLLSDDHVSRIFQDYQSEHASIRSRGEACFYANANLEWRETSYSSTHSDAHDGTSSRGSPETTSPPISAPSPQFIRGIYFIEERSEQQSSDNEIEGHSFVRKSSKKVVCPVCMQKVGKKAVQCEQCGLICHRKCVANAPSTCDSHTLLHENPSPVVSPSRSLKRPKSTHRGKKRRGRRANIEHLYRPTTPSTPYVSSIPAVHAHACIIEDPTVHSYASVPENTTRGVANAAGRSFEGQHGFYDELWEEQVDNPTFYEETEVDDATASWDDPELLSAWEDYQTRQGTEWEVVQEYLPWSRVCS